MIRRLHMLDALEERWMECQRCDLARSRTRPVQWRGTPDAPLMIVGDAPGSDEDAQSRPFVGVAGRLLDDALKRAGIERPEDNVFMANRVACRPPGDRAPERDELKACSPRFRLLLEIVQPRALLLLGSAAAELAGVSSVAAARGSAVDVDVLYNDGRVKHWPAVVTYSPSFVLRSGGLSWDRGRELVGDIRLAWKLSNSVD